MYIVAFDAGFREMALPSDLSLKAEAAALLVALPDPSDLKRPPTTVLQKVDSWKWCSRHRG